MKTIQETIAKSPDLKTFKAKGWHPGLRDYECTNTPFRAAVSNPDPEHFTECGAEDFGSAYKIEGGPVEQWGWL